ncbi:hypothetical protein GALL_519500 [mine drainage metagenome]|uniref:Uncharacterized protein n=1 Tax=mine drainage metagenome TaxID=410659 RepID=A0A1J5P5K6_9ZZZZ
MKLFRLNRLSSLLLVAALSACAAPLPPAASPSPPAQVASRPAPAQNDNVIDNEAVCRLLHDTPQTVGASQQNLTQRLLALGKRRTLSEQLQLAMLLLTRGEAGDAELAQNLLDGVQARAADAQARNFIALLQRDARQQRELDQARQTAQTLQTKINQIKSLETQLQNRAH